MGTTGPWKREYFGSSRAQLLEKAVLIATLVGVLETDVFWTFCLVAVGGREGAS